MNHIKTVLALLAILGVAYTAPIETVSNVNVKYEEFPKDDDGRRIMTQANIEIGSSNAGDILRDTGNAGFFGGEAGNINEVGISSNNTVAGVNNGLVSGKLVVGSSDKGAKQATATTGDSKAFGNSGSIRDSGVSQQNSVDMNSGVVGSLAVGNAANHSFTVATGSGGRLGGFAGTVNGGGISSGNSVAVPNGDQALTGNVGVSVGATLNDQPGEGIGLGDAGDITGGGISSGNKILP